ncbi:type II secretion system protein GspN [Desulfogranum japonicum]|uniref:type II secretion system protein GspN n=1 Tax=Desulfogranum japonicum TaxID=231447 RepID=UPI0003FD5AD5|nr:type II secretion system protein GspN [Desulfogranum japonicum]
MKLAMKAVKYFGYLVYCLLTLIVLLWLLFPATYVKEWPERYINARFPDIQLVLGEIAYTFPSQLACQQAVILDRVKQREIVKLQNLRSNIHILDFFKKGDVSLDYDAELYDGTVQGTGLFTRDSIHIDARSHGVMVEQMDWFRNELHRNIRGSVRADMAIDVGLPAGQVRSLVGNLTVTQGSVELKTPVFGLSNIVYDSLYCAVKGAANRIQMESCLLQADMFDVHFGGEIWPNTTLSRSTLNVKGTVSPKEDFISTLQSPMVQHLFRKKLQHVPLRFFVSGSVTKPHLSMGEYSLLNETLNSN